MKGEAQGAMEPWSMKAPPTQRQEGTTGGVVGLDAPQRSRRAYLLPRIGTLAGLDVLYHVLGQWGIGAVIGMIILLLWLAVLTLTVIECARYYACVHPTDLFLLRGAGPFAVGLAMALYSMLLVTAPPGSDTDVVNTWMATRMGRLGVGFAMELGFILCIACLSVGREAKPWPPRLLWKSLCLPLLLMYGMYVVVLELTSLFAPGGKA